MKTYKCVFSCESPLNTIPDAQKIFGALCRIIYDVKGDLQLQRYLQSLKSEDPIMIHSSMFPNHLAADGKKECEYPSGGLSSFKSPLGRIII